MTNTVAADGVAERVRGALSDAGLSINRLSELTGIPYPTLRRRIKVQPEYFTVDEIARIADVTGVEFAFLAAGAAAVAA